MTRQDWTHVTIRKDTRAIFNQAKGSLGADKFILSLLEKERNGDVESISKTTHRTTEEKFIATL